MFPAPLPELGSLLLPPDLLSKLPLLKEEEGDEEEGEEKEGEEEKELFSYF